MEYTQWDVSSYDVNLAQKERKKHSSTLKGMYVLVKQAENIESINVLFIYKAHLHQKCMKLPSGKKPGLWRAELIMWFLPNVAPFKRERNRLSKRIRLLTRKKKEPIYLT